MLHRQTHKKMATIAIVFLILANSILSPFFANARVDPGGGAGVANADSYSIPNQAKSWLYYNSMSRCMSYLKDDMTEEDALSGAWFKRGGVTAKTPKIGYFLDGINSGLDTNGNNVSCDGKNSNWIKDAWTLWGYSSGLQALCSFGAIIPGRDICAEGGGNLKTGVHYISTGGSSYTTARYVSKDSFQLAIKSMAYGGQPPAISQAATYILQRSAFFVGCLGSANPDIYSGAANDGHIYTIDYVDSETGVLTSNKYKSTLDKVTHDTKIWYEVNSSGSDVGDKCIDIASAINDNAESYKAAIDKLINDTGKGEAPSKPTGAAVTAAKTCGSEVTGIGWILCPITNMLVGFNDLMWSLVETLLTVNPLNQSDAIYTAWSSIRSIANVLFVIFFLLIIFSQLTSFGIDNYGIKKLLPRLIVCAIMVNISFIIVQIAVDLANIVGSSLQSLLTGITLEYVPSWGAITGIILSGNALIAGGLLVAAFSMEAAFWLLVPMALMGLLGLLAAMLTLVFRQAIIPILAILAPLAFVAYLLPNTEQWFKKWRSMLATMLMMYPMAALIFGGSKFAASVIVADHPDEFWANLIGLIVLSAPLFSLPFLVRQGGPILSKVGGALKGLAEKARSPLTNWGKDRSSTAQAEYLANGPRTKLGQWAERTPGVNAVTGLNRRHARSSNRAKLDREQRRTAAGDEFKDQAMSDEGIAGAFGKRKNVRQSLDRANAAKQSLATAHKESDTRVREQNPNRLNERVHGAELADQTSKDNNTGRLAADRSFDNARRLADHAKTNANTATTEAETRTERAPGTLQVRALNTSATEKLASTKLDTETVINEAAAGVSIAEQSITSVGSASDIDDMTSAVLQDNKLEQQIGSSANAAAKQKQTEFVTETLLAPGPAPGVVNESVRRAAGVGGTTGQVRVQAAATSAQNEFRQQNVKANRTLFTERGWGVNSDVAAADGQLIRIITTGRKPDGSTASAEEIETAMGMIVDTGSREGQAIISDELFNRTVPGTNDTQETIKLRQAFGAMVSSSSQKSKAIGGRQLGALAAGQQGQKFDELYLDAAKAKISSEGLVGLDKDDIKGMAASIAANPGSFDIPQRTEILQVYERARLNPDLWGKVSKEQKAQIVALLAAIGPIPGVAAPTPVD